MDPSNPSDPIAQLSVVLLALFGQMERTTVITDDVIENARSTLVIGDT